MLDAYVIGHGIPELAAALELAEVGLRVRIGAPAALPASQLDTAVLDGVARDAAVPAGQPTAPDHGERDPEGVLRSFLAHAAAPITVADVEAPGRGAASTSGTKDASAETPSSEPARGFATAEPVTCAANRTLLRGANGDWQALPEPNVWGVPAVPMSSDSIALLGGRGALRASVDRIRPVLTIGKTTALGALVRSRMGQQMLDRGVDPLVREHFGCNANDVDVAIAAPGLNGALTVAGSLSGAVLIEAEDHAAREALVRPAGGWQALRSVLMERLELYGVQFGLEVAEVVELEAAAGSTAAAADHLAPHWRVSEAEGETFEATAVIVGVSSLGPSSKALLAAEAPTVHSRWRATLQAQASTADLPAGLEEAAAVAAQGSGSDGASDRGIAAVAEAPAGWSVLYERVAPDQWLATASGPAEAAPTEVGAAAQAVREEHPALAHAAVEWQLAPWAQLETQENAVAELADERAEGEWRLRVGRGLHAGSLAAAVADARQASVNLRRRLTGISE